MNGLTAAEIIEKRLENDSKYYSLPIKVGTYLFDAFHGRRYDDNPFYLCMHYLKSGFMSPEDVTWVYYDEEVKNQIPSEFNKVKYNSEEFIKACYENEYIITNSYISPLFTKKINQKIINTWHGTGAFKKFGLDNPEEKRDEVIMAGPFYDTVYSTCKEQSEYIRRVLYMTNADLIEGEPPRIKYLDSYLKKREIDNLFLILHAPTMRMNKGKMVESPLFDYKKVSDIILEKSGHKVTFLTRLHYLDTETVLPDSTTKDEDPHVMNSLYNADFVITDFSSIICDAKIMGKEGCIYYPDYGKHECQGFYTEPENHGYKVAEDEEEIAELIMESLKR